MTRRPVVGLAGSLSREPARHSGFRGLLGSLASRRSMPRSGGVKPEDLPVAGDIKKIRGDLKAAHKDFKKLDKPKKRP
jgi:hypothetical protein